MGEINWVVTILLGALISIPFGIFANLLTRRFEGWLGKQAISFKGKSLARIMKEYNRIKAYKDTPTLIQLKVNFFVIRSLLTLNFFMLAVILSGVAFFIIRFGTTSDNLNAIIGLLMLASFSFVLLTTVYAFISLYTSGNLEEDMSRLEKFDEYEKQALSNVEALKKAAEEK